MGRKQTRPATVDPAVTRNVLRIFNRVAVVENIPINRDGKPRAAELGDVLGYRQGSTVSEIMAGQKIGSLEKWCQWAKKYKFELCEVFPGGISTHPRAPLTAAATRRRKKARAVGKRQRQ